MIRLSLPRVSSWASDLGGRGASINSALVEIWGELIDQVFPNF